MRKAGLLRRIGLLGCLAFVYERFVLPNPAIAHTPEAATWLRWVLYGAVAFGVITMLADRLTSPETPERRNHDDRD